MGTLSIAGGSLNVSGTTGIAGTLTVAGASYTANGDTNVNDLSLSGILAGTGNVLVTNALNWSTDASGAGTMSGPGITVVGALATATLSEPLGTSDLSLGRELDIAGKTSVSDNTNLDLGIADANASLGFDPATISVLQGGSLSLANDVTLADASNGAVASEIDNAGTLTKTGSGASTIAVAVANAGILDVKDGTLAITGAFTNTGTVSVESGGILRLSSAVTNSSDIHVAAGGGLELDGTFTMEDEDPELRDPQHAFNTVVTGPQLIDAGDLTTNGNVTLVGQVSFGTTLTVSGGKLELGATSEPHSLGFGTSEPLRNTNITINHGELDANLQSYFDAGLFTADLTVSYQDSKLVVAGGFSVLGTLNWTAGTIIGINPGVVNSFTGDIATNSGAGFNIGDPSGGGQVVLGCELSGGGTVYANTTVWFGASDNTAAKGFDPGTVDVVGTLTINDGDNFSDNSNGTVASFFDNQGTVIKSGIGTSTIGVAFTNFFQGVVDVQGGTLVLSGGLSSIGTLKADGGNLVITRSGGGRIVNGGGNQVTGTGIISANSEMEFGGAAATDVSFATGSTGTLRLDDSREFTGTVAGLSNVNSLDLSDVSFGANTQASYNSSGGVLTVKQDATNPNSAAAHILLQGDYTSAVWSVTSDGHGGTLVHDPSIISAQDPAGNTTIGTNGGLDLAAGSPQNILFAGNAGTLTLEDLQGFTGQISGFGGADQIDLADIAFDANTTTLGYSGNSGNTGGTLSVSDGTQTANLALLGSYMASSFATSSDGHGGTLITDSAQPSSQPPLTPPH